MSDSFGKNLRVTLFGASHGPAIGAVIEGLPAGFFIDEAQVDFDMKRRSPSSHAASTPRQETDAYRILSGVHEGNTTGDALCVVIENQNAHSEDYHLEIPRPGHADYTAYLKYKGFADMRGGGHFSGRLTAPLVFAGALAKQLLLQKGITVGGHILSAGTVADRAFDPLHIPAETLHGLKQKPFPILDEAQGLGMQAEIEKVRQEGDSLGGLLEIAAIGVPGGLGEPFFDSVESCLAHGLFAIPGVKGVSFGDGFMQSQSTGSCMNDGLTIKDGQIGFLSNHQGGINGGITNGAPILVKVAMRPTASIYKTQSGVNLKTMQETQIQGKGRHDSFIALRALPVAESIMCMVLLDLLWEGEKS